MIHELKIASNYFEDVLMDKSFEIRKNDRDYHIGDILHLREYDGDYTGRSVDVRVRYILTSDDFPDGIKDGYCIMAIQRLRK